MRHLWKKNLARRKSSFAVPNSSSTLPGWTGRVNSKNPAVSGDFFTALNFKTPGFRKLVAQYQQVGLYNVTKIDFRLKVEIFVLPFDVLLYIRDSQVFLLMGHIQLLNSIAGRKFFSVNLS